MAYIETPESSNIHGFEHDPENKRLTVAFKSGGKYHYHDVPEDKVHAFTNAKSKGQFLQQNIKNSHRHEKAS